MKTKKFTAIVRRHKSQFIGNGYMGKIVSKELKAFVGRRVEVIVRHDRRQYAK